ncbi:MAG: hypothetical protein U9M89_01060 [Patescibacteria group bacterium]|nr:hypothetical protein [Patescibacteria group bacterium]
MNIDIYKVSRDMVESMGGLEAPSVVIWSQLIDEEGILVPRIDIQVVGGSERPPDESLSDELFLAKLQMSIVQIAYVTILIEKIISMMEKGESLSIQKTGATGTVPLIQDFSDKNMIPKEYLGIIAVQLGKICADDGCYTSTDHPMFFSSVPEEETLLNLKTICAFVSPRIFVTYERDGRKVSQINFNFFDELEKSTFSPRYVPYTPPELGERHCF